MLDGTKRLNFGNCSSTDKIIFIVFGVVLLLIRAHTRNSKKKFTLKEERAYNAVHKKNKKNIFND